MKHKSFLKSNEYNLHGKGNFLCRKLVYNDNQTEPWRAVKKGKKEA